MKDIIFVLIFGWLIFVTYLIFSLKKHYQNLISHTHKRRLNEILDQLINNDNNFKKNHELITQKINQLENEAKLHLQKFSIIRYNPFEERGDKSFVIALLNNKKSGFILNFIYTRDGLRTYIKEIINGQPEKGQLSDEERKAIETSFSKD